MKAGLLVIAPLVLERLLQLPEGVHIVDARMSFGHSGVMHIKVEGAGYDCQPGCMLPWFTGVVTKTGDGETINWGFPKEDHK